MPVVAQLTQDEFDRIMKSFRSLAVVPGDDPQTRSKQVDSMFGPLQRPREVAEDPALSRNWSDALLNHDRNGAPGAGIIGQGITGSRGTTESLNQIPYHELPVEEQYHIFERSITRYKSNLYGPEDLRYEVWKPMMFERQLFQGGDYSYGMLPEPYVFEPPPEPIPWIEEMTPSVVPTMANSTGEMMTPGPRADEDFEPILRPPQCSINWQNKTVQAAPVVEMRGREIPTRFSRYVYPNGEPIFGGFSDFRFPPPFHMPPHRRNFFDNPNSSPFPFLIKNKRRPPALRGSRPHVYIPPTSCFPRN